MGSLPTQRSCHSPAIEIVETHGLIPVQQLEEAHRGTEFGFVRPLMFPRQIGVELGEPRHRIGLGNAQEIGSRPRIIRAVFVADGGFERRSLGIIPGDHGARPCLPESINRGILYSLGEYITIIDSDDEYKPNHLSSCLQEIKDVDLICSTSETIVDNDNDYYVPDKNDLTKLIHLDEVTLFGTLFGRKKVFNSIAFKTGFAADADFYERAT